MAYCIAKKPVFLVKSIVVETFDDGRWVKESVDAAFARQTGEELDALREVKQPEVLRKVLTNVTGLRDDAGQEVPFTPETLEAIVNIPPLMAALARAFWDHQVKAREKN